MSATPQRIDRTGVMSFGDASLSICEYGLSQARAAGGWAAEKAWELRFKRDVFARIVQTMNRLGWTCTMPEIKPHDVQHYGGDVARWSAERERLCAKGDLKANLHMSGRCITLEMFQNVHAPDRPDYDGRYQSNKEAHMPYLLRLEMERTRRRIRDYLCNVFTGYTFDTKKRSIYSKQMERTAMECIQEHYAESWHFKGDLTRYEISDYNRKSAEGGALQHGQRVYFFDWHGRLCYGTALYNINNMWWVVTGKYDYTNLACFDLHTKCPENPRVKRNAERRRARLEAELAAAVKSMRFERAAQLRDILFPGDQPLFNVWHTGHQLYHRAGFRGYTADQSQAGKFTADEVRGWNDAGNQVVPITEPAAA